MTKTLRLRATEPADIERAAAILREGGTVAFPTETVYGLGANALDEVAVAKIFTAKQRPSWDPLITHVPDASQRSSLTQLDDNLAARMASLAEAFWPGPLALLLPRKAVVPDSVTAGRPLIGLRVPRHPIALALLRAAGVPVAAPSANTFGHVSPTTAAHVLDDLDGRIDAVLDGGPTLVGVESTVLDPAQTPMVLYRPGAISAKQISAVTGIPVEIFVPEEKPADAPPESLPSPGVGIRHYAPRARVLLVQGSEAALAEATAMNSQEAMGILLPTGWTTSATTGLIIEAWGAWDDPEELAARLFASLRSFDEHGAKLILIPLPPAGGLNDAIRDRLMKAARTA